MKIDRLPKKHSELLNVQLVKMSKTITSTEADIAHFYSIFWISDLEASNLNNVAFKELKD